MVCARIHGRIDTRNGDNTGFDNADCLVEHGDENLVYALSFLISAVRIEKISNKSPIIA